MACQKVVDKFKDGLWVEITKLEPDFEKGLLVVPQLISNRCIGKIGIVNQWVPGHGGDVWKISHPEDETAAVYGFTEFEEVDEKTRDYYDSKYRSTHKDALTTNEVIGSLDQ